jgi:hypothetical protein
VESLKVKIAPEGIRVVAAKNLVEEARTVLLVGLFSRTTGSLNPVCHTKRKSLFSWQVTTTSSAKIAAERRRPRPPSSFRML